MQNYVRIGFVIVQVGLFTSLAHHPILSCRVTSVFKTFVMLSTEGSSKRSCNLVQRMNDWNFSNSKFLEFPLDKVKENYLRRNNLGCLFSVVYPTPLKDPSLVAYSKDVLINILNMDPKITKTKQFVNFITGNNVLNSSTPLAHRYGGHQFGYWSNQLGDGRAILLGEFTNGDGERWELQLKGSGKTPYSRDGDGRAVLRSSIREFLCSEAMYYLGIPTSRAAAIVVSDDEVIRDPLYDGNPVLEKSAVVLRVAPTWFRFGSFELPVRTNETHLLETLFNFILKEHFPEIDSTAEDKILTFFTRVCRMTSDLVISWQGVGFTHGVLNTDNMSVLGITIDYGPFGFVEAYDPEYVPNASDHEARYCYIRQPNIILYNLIKLSQALAPLMTEAQKNQAGKVLKEEAKYTEDNLMKMFSGKLGLPQSEPELVILFLTLMEETRADFTMTFRELSEAELENVEKSCPKTHWALATISKHAQYPKFLKLYKEKLQLHGVSEEDRRSVMCKRNPRYVLRNWMAQLAIQEANNGNYIEVERLLRVLTTPFTKQEEAEKLGFASPSPQWASKLRLSCSS